MKKITGCVQNFNCTPDISGSSVDGTGYIETTHSCTLTIDDVSSRLNSKTPPVLHDGDAVTVIGETCSSGIFDIFAYYNETKNVKECVKAPSGLIGYSLLFLLGGGILYFGSVYDFVPVMVVGGLILLGGAVGALPGLKKRKNLVEAFKNITT